MLQKELSAFKGEVFGIRMQALFRLLRKAIVDWRERLPEWRASKGRFADDEELDRVAARENILWSLAVKLDKRVLPVSEELVADVVLLSELLPTGGTQHNIRNGLRPRG